MEGEVLRVHEAATSHEDCGGKLVTDKHCRRVVKNLGSVAKLPGAQVLLHHLLTERDILPLCDLVSQPIKWVK